MDTRIDEVKFENIGTLTVPQGAIMEGQDATTTTETGDQFPVTGLQATSNLPNGLDQTVNTSASFFTFTSSEPSTAMVDSAGTVTILDAGTSVITAMLGETAAAGSLTVTSTGDPILPESPAPVPTVNADSVISMFSNAYTNVPVDVWNTYWQFSTAESDELQIDGDDVIRYKNLNFVGIEFTSQTINATDMTHFHIDIWTPNSTNLPASFKVLLVDFGPDNTFDGGDDSSHEVSFTSPTLQSNQWVSLDIPLSNFTGLVNRANLAQLVLSGDLPTVIIDNVYFYNGGGSTSSGGPTSAAPAPSYPAGDVISVFSDAYSNLGGTDFYPDWGQATVVSEVAVSGDNTLLYSGLNYQGTQFASAIDASAMTHLRLDVFTENSSMLNVFLISTGPVETPYAIPVPTSGWSTLEIPLSSFAPVDMTDIIQMKFDGNGDIYLDNILFYKSGGSGGTEPTVGAPEPTYNAANVISIFSDTYTEVPGTDFNPDWGQATAVSTVNIAGNNTLLYSGLNYQGTQLTPAQDVSGMTTLRVDIWTANSTMLNIYLISTGPIETPYAIPVPTSGWSTLEIPLTDFAPVDMTDIIQFKFDGNGDIYIDNLLFFN